MYSISDCIIIIPVHNEVKSIGTVIERNGDLCPYIIVDDHSNDGTKDLCMEAGYPIISSGPGRGKQNAVKTGIQYALENGFCYVVTLDGDGQHPPKYIPAMVSILRSGSAEIVIGSRFVTKNKPFTLRMIGSRIITQAIKNKTGHRIEDPTSGMHAYSKAVMKDIADSDLHYAEPDLLTDEILRGRRVSELQVHMLDRLYGRSAYGTAADAARYMIRTLRNIRETRKTYEYR